MSSKFYLSGLLSLLCLCLLAGCRSGGEAREVDLLIVGGTVIDPASRSVVRDAAVAIDAGVIVAAGQLDARAFKALRTLDASGKFIVPAFVDMHLHWGTGTFVEGDHVVETTLARSLYYGVTRILNMGSNAASPSEIDGFRSKLAAGEWQGPKIYAVGSLLTVPSSHPTTTIYSPDVRQRIAEVVAAAPASGPIDLMPLRAVTLLRTPDDARAEVKRLATWGADVIKITIESGPGPFGDDHPQMPRDVVQAVVDAAHDAGIPVIAHISSRDELDVCLDTGVDAAAHAIITGPFDTQLHRRMGESKFFYSVTLNLYDGFLNWTADPTRMDDPFLRETVTDAEVASTQGTQRFFEREREYFGRSGLPPILDHVRAAQQAGAILLTGTDTGNPYAFPGYGVHEELRLMVAGGVSAMDALAASSANAARFFKEERQWGSIAPGQEADLLVLDGDPLADIANTRRIVQVIQRGQPVDRSRLKIAL
ncbi:MAG TPA: amidohydrolase family protein [Povalibacter sp.]|uniref:amidohydrolase family protein n=1 Tax=Povalibacter sp. TaxID=1962978 RepID=UPI002C7E21C7|nr:amidohydrolase family protein [Povalibacter sp.]HMN47236.1 amidohydrolase family protein [Povalibacter sp.]